MVNHWNKESISKLHRESGMSLRDLAKRIGVDRHSLTRWIRGDGEPLPHNGYKLDEYVATINYYKFPFREVKVLLNSLIKSKVILEKAGHEEMVMQLNDAIDIIADKLNPFVREGEQ